MSKKNILSKEDVGKAVHVTFETPAGNYIYSYSGSSARALKRGTDPGNLSGKLVRFDKADKKD